MEKKCPGCNYDLPLESHFCPRCMYKYPKNENVTMPDEKQTPKQITKQMKKPRSRYFLVCSAILIVMLAVVLMVGNNIKKHSSVNDKNSDVDALDNSEEQDYEDALTDYDNIKDIFGKETESDTYQEEGCTVHGHGNTDVYVRNDGIVQKIVIIYNDDWRQKTQDCSIYGINGKSEKDAVNQEIGTLGNPDTVSEDGEWYYYFDTVENDYYSTLVITFDEYGVVYRLDYYREDKPFEEQTNNWYESEGKNAFESDGRIGTLIPMNDRLEHDYRYGLTDYNSLKEELGESTDVVIGEDGLTACEHGNVTVYVDNQGQVQEIYIYYQNGKNPRGSGIYGIDAITSKTEINQIFGEPDEIEGGYEWQYHFKSSDSPTLSIAFGGDDVESVSLYRVNVD